MYKKSECHRRVTCFAPTSTCHSPQVIMPTPELKELELAKSRSGRRAQLGGAVAIFLGALLLVATPPASQGAPINVHQMAAVFVVIGTFALAAGTLARWYYLK
ncbi:MAG: hypothetical protein WB630_00705 [Candidatus Acidiferrales bacterium]